MFFKLLSGSCWFYALIEALFMKTTRTEKEMSTQNECNVVACLDCIYVIFLTWLKKWTPGFPYEPRTSVNWDSACN